MLKLINLIPCIHDFHNEVRCGGLITNNMGTMQLNIPPQPSAIERRSGVIFRTSVEWICILLGSVMLAESFVAEDKERWLKLKRLIFFLFACQRIIKKIFPFIELMQCVGNSRAYNVTALASGTVQLIPCTKQIKTFRLTGIPRAILDTITGKSISAPPYKREKITMKEFLRETVNRRSLKITYLNVKTESSLFIWFHSVRKNTIDDYMYAWLICPSKLCKDKKKRMRWNL